MRRATWRNSKHMGFHSGLTVGGIRREELSSDTVASCGDSVGAGDTRHGASWPEYRRGYRMSEQPGGV